MASITHISQYAQYKQDTNDVAAWLLTTHPEFKPKGPGRLKGKARKAAQAADARPRATEYTLTLDQFTQWAKAIVSAGIIKQVPPMVMIKLRRSIVRRRYQRRFYEHSEDASSNASHEHFISVLEQVEQILRPITPKEVLGKDAGSDEEELIEALGNRFQGLEVQEAADEAPGSTAATSPPIAVSCKVAEDAANTPNPLYAVGMLLDDMCLMMRYVRDSWQAYRDGRNSLETAALISDMTFHLIMKLADELQEEGVFERVSGGWPKAFHDLWVVCQKALEKGVRDGGAATGDAGIKSHHRLILDITYLLALIPATLELKQDLDVSGLVRDNVSACDWTTDHRRRLQRLVLEEAIVELRLFDLTTTLGLPRPDCFTRTLRDAMYTRKLSLELLFGVCIFLEARLTLGPEVDRPSSQLLSFIEVTQPQIVQTLECHGEIPSAHQDMADTVSSWLDITDKIVGVDKVYQARRTRGVLARRLALFACQPMLCGVLLSYCKFSTYQMGVSWANNLDAVVAVCHLYNAAQQENALPDGWSWPSVEGLLNTYPSMFLGQKRPTYWGDYVRSLTKALGIFHGQRKSRLPWQFPPQAATIQKLQLCGFDRTNDWTVDDIMRVLRESQVCQTVMRPTAKGAAEPKLRVVDALELLGKCIHAEVAEIVTVSWFQLHTICWRILTTIRSELEELRQAFDSAYKEINICVIIVLLFLQPKRRELLHEAVRIMQTVLSAADAEHCRSSGEKNQTA
ncbi:uncharacterized protein BO97DRAFT_423982 [Aspergillus homomorphus CBS 101889]|uniref:DUF6604 domain-containing protein n=1 Tax=Aspergillus homomorphus (strain CBS 101889) TaxID=1450537 RepID=A0A395I284_ASPHC|nr:hypothetical protein BO97DRAFT_423982 [Aspergillus homomorphus CBS 101889]RAL13288.1 hypothetical protein BO97DRAFT_423982 [Aspergillus homomorphus CBS 101889]